MRPIRDRLEMRVRANIFLGMLAYYAQWHMIEAWSPRAFKDETDTEPIRRADPWPRPDARPRRSPRCTRRTLADGTPAMSFTRLTAHLGTIVRNALRPWSARPGEATFTLTTRPSPKQQQALDLIAAIAL